MLDNHPTAIGVDGVNLRVVRLEHRQPARVCFLHGNSDATPRSFSYFVQRRTLEHHLSKVGGSVVLFNQRYAFFTPRTPSASVRI